MFASDRVLALNIGASKILLAEFSAKSGHPPVLLNYGVYETGGDPESEVSLGDYLGEAIRQIMRGSGIRPAPLLLSLSGQMVFPRFVRLPAVSQEKLLQMVEYEVEQNVPFPMADIVWNHQFLGDGAMGEQAAMIVAAKLESVREVTEATTGIGLEPEIVDVAPMALYNCLRHSEPGLDGCTILLDIGARTTNLIVVEEDKIYNRCIATAGNAITQELAKGLGISFAEAEQLKRERAFVALGGVYAADDAEDDRISKIVRTVVTRLHAEISRSINFYRRQQGGSAPTRLILTGGSAVLPQLDIFFKEKLNVEVSYLNPFNNVGVGPRVDSERLQSDAFVLAEAVGLALRRAQDCPVEINLMPPEIVRRKSFRKRIPFFVLSAIALMATLGVWTVYQYQMLQIFQGQRDQITEKLDRLEGEQKKLKQADGIRQGLISKADAEAELMGKRTLWLKRIDAVRKGLFPGVWLTDISPVKDGETGEVIGLSIKGCGWKDRLKEQAEKAKTAGREPTGEEVLCDRIKQQTVFSNGSVSIKSTRDGGYYDEFTLEALFEAPQQDGNSQNKNGNKR